MRKISSTAATWQECDSIVVSAIVAMKHQQQEVRGLETVMVEAQNRAKEERIFTILYNVLRVANLAIVDLSIC